MASSTLAPDQPRSAESWASFGDINGFFGLMLDNIGVMILMAGLLVGVYGMPADFVLSRIIDIRATRHSERNPEADSDWQAHVVLQIG